MSSTEAPLVSTLLRTLHLLVRRRIHEDLHAAGFTDLTPAHVYVFQRPGPEGVRPTELAARANTTKQALNHLLAGLEARGYLTRHPAADDGRATVIHLTPRGRAVTDVMVESSKAIEREWAAALGTRRVDDLRRMLGSFEAVSKSRTDE